MAANTCKEETKMAVTNYMSVNGQILSETTNGSLELEEASLVRCRVLLVLSTMFLIGCSQNVNNQPNAISLPKFSESILAEWQEAKFDSVESKVLPAFFEFRKNDFQRARTYYRKWLANPDDVFKFIKSKPIVGELKTKYIKDVLFADDSAVWSKVSSLKYTAVLLSSKQDNVVLVIVEHERNFKLCSVPYSINSLQLGQVVDEIFQE
jgi:hypothetical protein